MRILSWSDYVYSMRSELCSRVFYRDLFVEFLGTFLLVAVQAALPLKWNGNLGDIVQVALGMGTLVTCLAWSLGDLGGCHMNPAVSISLAVTLKITASRALIYIPIQCLGGISGAAFTYAITPAHRRDNLSATLVNPEIAPWQGVLMEILVTFIVVLTVFGSINDARKKSLLMPTVPIGFAVVMGTLTGIGYTGPSMNPARSLGPAVMMGLWEHHWVFWVGPITGAVLAGTIYVYFIDRIDREDDFEEADLDDTMTEDEEAAMKEMVKGKMPVTGLAGSNAEYQRRGTTYRRGTTGPQTVMFEALHNTITIKLPVPVPEWAGPAEVTWSKEKRDTDVLGEHQPNQNDVTWPRQRRTSTLNPTALAGAQDRRPSVIQAVLGVNEAAWQRRPSSLW